MFRSIYVLYSDNSIKEDESIKEFGVEYTS